MANIAKTLKKDLSKFRKKSICDNARNCGLTAKDCKHIIPHVCEDSEGDCVLFDKECRCVPVDHYYKNVKVSRYRMISSK